jgi:ankyrin repeat protein
MKIWLLIIMMIIPSLIFTEETLLDAVNNGDAAFIRNYKGDLNQPLDEEGSTLLILTVKNNQIDLFKELIKAKVNVNKPDSEGITALMIAAGNERPVILKALITSKANVNATDNFGKTALMVAAINGNTDAVKALIKAGADVNIAITNGELPMGDETGYTSLIFAAIKGKSDIVKILIDAKANVNAQSKDGVTALMKASWKGSIDAVKLLLAAKANVNAITKTGTTALTFSNPTLKNILKDAGAKDNTYIITGDDVRVRTDAGTNSEVLLSLDRGAEVRLINRSNKTFNINGKKAYWVYINTEISDNKGGMIYGWVIDYYLKEEAN